MIARRGVALVLVLWLIVALGAIGVTVGRMGRTSVAIASNARAEVIARAAAESGIEAGVAAIEDTLAAMAGADERQAWLNALATARGDSLAIGDGRVLVTIVDVSSRLDVNNATEPALGRFFSQFTDASEAASIARAIRFHIDSGGSGATGGARLLRSLDELRARRLAPDAILARAAPYLTVDGDGTVNRRAASDTVLVAAAGELRDEPARLLLISRGWATGHALTCEIQAVYAISGNRLVFSHWRERLL